MHHIQDDITTTCTSSNLPIKCLIPVGSDLDKLPTELLLLRSTPGSEPSLGLLDRFEAVSRTGTSLSMSGSSGVHATS